MSANHTAGASGRDLRKYYEILEVGPRAPTWVIKRQYRRLAKRWHPDHFANDPVRQKAAEEKMKAINDAYHHIQNAPLRYGGPSRRHPPHEPSQRTADFDIHAWMAKAEGDDWEVRYFVLGCLGVPALFYVLLIAYILLFYRRFLGPELLILFVPGVIALVLLVPGLLGAGDWLLKRIWG